MSTALQVFHVFTRAARGQISGSAARASVPWADLIEIDHSLVGDPGDEVVWIAHGDFGQWQWIGSGGGPLNLGTLVGEIGVDVFPTASSPGFYESTTWLDFLAENGAFEPNNFARLGFSAGFMVRDTLDGTSFRFAARIGLGPFPAQQVGIGEILGQFENVSVMAINLTRATSRGVHWQWTDNYAFPLPTTLPSYVAAGGSNPLQSASLPVGAALTAPTVASDRTYLVVGAGIVAPGSKTDRYGTWLGYLDPLGLNGTSPLRTRSGPAGHRARSQDPDNNATQFPHLQNVLLSSMHRVPANEVGHEWQFFGADSYIAQGAGISRQSTAASGLLLFDLTAFQPDFDWRPGDEGGATSFAGPTEWPLYGPAPGEPDEDEVDTRADLNVTTFVGTRKAVICWAVPRLEVSPTRFLGFHHAVSINEEVDLIPGVPSDPVHIVSQTEHDALPCYVTGELQTGRGALALVARGQFSPGLLGSPSRIPAPARYQQQTNGALFAAWNLFEGVQTTAEPPTVAPGPEVYVSIDPEAPDPSTLPRFPYQHDEGIEVEPIDQRGALPTPSGRTLTWGRTLSPRRRIRLSWTLPPAMHELFMQWLEGLESPLVQYAIEGEQPRAYALLSQSRTGTLDIDEGIRRVDLSMVELIWTQAPEGGE